MFFFFPKQRNTTWLRQATFDGSLESSHDSEPYEHLWHLVKQIHVSKKICNNVRQICCLHHAPNNQRALINVLLPTLLLSWRSWQSSRVLRENGNLAPRQPAAGHEENKKTYSATRTKTEQSVFLYGFPEIRKLSQPTKEVMLEQDSYYLLQPTW